ncbi:hypothetical protein EVAR_38824_1 [Eumeta japonica]|uniref:Uncharacterized protein n=1 Tax=Eumeta variegata TaxID=151549 RepID=A0A4C1XNH9_EUMVA|nr:hypothetical protein EVAR_38824_1 [Eumeta japonica]
MMWFESAACLINTENKSRLQIRFDDFSEYRTQFTETFEVLLTILDDSKPEHEAVLTKRPRLGDYGHIAYKRFLSVHRRLPWELKLWEKRTVSAGGTDRTNGGRRLRAAEMACKQWGIECCWVGLHGLQFIGFAMLRKRVMQRTRLTIPKLELSGAELLVKLIDHAVSWLCETNNIDEFFLIAW